MPDMSVTDETSHSERSELNISACQNIRSCRSPDETSQFERSE